MSLKPICFPCQRFYRPEKNGFHFTEGMPTHGAEPGKRDANLWLPYKLWIGDKWRCEGCGHEIISGVGMEPVRVQHEADFKEIAKSHGFDQYQVNDC